jgi:hypothetical protein
MEESRGLPIGIQVFEDVIKLGAVYVDKTRYLAQMIETVPRPGSSPGRGVSANPSSSPLLNRDFQAKGNSSKVWPSKRGWTGENTPPAPSSTWT